MYGTQYAHDILFLLMIEKYPMKLINDLLYDDKGERIVVSVNQAQFQHVFSCFHNFEITVAIVQLCKVVASLSQGCVMDVSLCARCIKLCTCYDNLT